MYESFSDRARKVMQLANQKAQRFNHEFIGTEHILLGLVEEGGGLGCTILKEIGVDLRKIRLEVEKLLMQGPRMITMGKLPQTPGAKQVLEHAVAWKQCLSHSAIGTEHLLLGLVTEPEGIATQVLCVLGVTTEGILAVLNRILTGPKLRDEVYFKITLQEEQPQQPIFYGDDTSVPKNKTGWYWVENVKGQVYGTEMIEGYFFSSKCRYQRMTQQTPTFPPRIPDKVDTVLYRLIKDVADNKAGYLFWGLKISNYVYDAVKSRGFNLDVLEEVKQ